MSAEDWMPDYDPEYEEAYCNRCGAGPLLWMAYPSWHLIDDDGNRHYCQPTDEDFE